MKQLKQINGTMMQYFEWYLDVEEGLWNKVADDAENLSNLGITSVWLPPAYKGMAGKNEVGYGVYDLYDLGEFNQKGSVPTKYGTKDEYIRAIESLKRNFINVYADIVLNHKMGADKLQDILVNRCDWGDHTKVESNLEEIKAATKFTFPGRGHKYSSFEWNWTHFKGIDINSKNTEKALFKFKDKSWAECVDKEFANFDYLMGADIDFSNPEVVEECKRWGKWYLETTRVDGFRLDAVKHIDALFYKEWLKYLREESGKELFTVGEYWSYNVDNLHNYLKETEGAMSLFDVPLHNNFYNASVNPEYDMSTILNKTLVKENPASAVTFVDNHDTQPGQALQSYVEEWFKAIAYAIILLRKEGYPCVFYGDLYGIKHSNNKPVERIKTLLALRKIKAYGRQHDYFDHPNVIGWTREGDTKHLDSGLAVVASNSFDAEKRMYVGTGYTGEEFIDCLDNCPDVVHIDEQGCGVFRCKGRSVSVWVRK